MNLLIYYDYVDAISVEIESAIKVKFYIDGLNFIVQ